MDNATLKNTNVGLVHDWLRTVAGGEHVVAEIAQMFDQGAVYTLFDFLTGAERPEVTHTHPVHVSSLNSFFGMQKYSRYLLLQCTRAIEQFNVRYHGVVVSSFAALIKGALTLTEPAQVPLIAKAFSERPSLKLVTVGAGPEMARVRVQAGPNVEILGLVSLTL